MLEIDEGADEEEEAEVGTTRTGLKAEESPDSVERALSLEVRKGHQTLL